MVVLRYPIHMSRVCVVVVSVLMALLGASGCTDPCVALQERICNCEKTANERQACIADRITNQQATTKIDDDDRAFCSEKLDTCTCAALDDNDLAQCGFTNEGT